jgi:hypothetical protein
VRQDVDTAGLHGADGDETTVLDVPHHDRRHVPLGSREEDRRARNSGDMSLCDL